MKRLILLVSICFIGISYSQEQKEIDQRMLDFHGEVAVNLYENNRDYYNFLVYELDNSFYIIDQSDQSINGNNKDNYYNINSVTSKGGVAFNISLLNDPSFNFNLYSFVRSQDERTYYDLGDGRLLVFYSLREIKANYPGQK